MNEAHQHCGSDEWRQAIREVILPWALGDVDLGEDVLEVGPGYGATTDVLSKAVPQLTSVEIDDELAAMLTDRFADVPSVEIVRGDATSLTPSIRRACPPGWPRPDSSRSRCAPIHSGGRPSRGEQSCHASAD